MTTVLDATLETAQEHFEDSEVIRWLLMKEGKSRQVQRGDASADLRHERPFHEDDSSLNLSIEYVFQMIIEVQQIARSSRPYTIVS